MKNYTEDVGLAESKIRSNLLFSRLPEDRSTKILEVGIGSGDITTFLAEAYDSVECVDCSVDDSFKVASRVKHRNVKFHIGFIESVPIEQKFGRIILMNLLEHLVDPVQVLKKLAGLLNPNGVIHVTVPLANSLHRHLGVVMDQIEKTTDLAESDRSYGHYRVYTPDLLKQHINAAGLRMTYVKPCYFKLLPTAYQSAVPWEIHQALDQLAQKFPEFAAYAYSEIKA